MTELQIEAPGGRGVGEEGDRELSQELAPWYLVGWQDVMMAVLGKLKLMRMLMLMLMLTLLLLLLKSVVLMAVPVLVLVLVLVQPYE